MNALGLYRAAYRLFEETTPTGIDCGAACGALCCAGGADRGMILFPGEEAALKGARFLRITERRGEALSGRFASCRGRCDRRNRPLSCRIFPLAPRFDGERLTVRDDPRAALWCPLLTEEGRALILPEFEAAVASAFTQLLELPEMGPFLLRYTQVLDDYAAFVPRMGE